MGKNIVEMKVTIHSEKPGDFDIVPSPSLPNWDNKKNDFEFSNGLGDGFLLNFKLQGNALGYRFPDDEDEALYSALGTRCPTTKGQWDQFEAESVINNNKTLVVVNRNDYEAEFAYTLRVQKTVKGAIKWLELDPGGLNKNGSTRLTDVAQLVAVAVTSAAATILVLLSFGLLKRK